MISVVICTYNRAHSLTETLASLARMQVPADLSWELLLVDNNSSDGTRAVIEDFARTSGFKVQYVFEAKQGLSHARNAGIRAAIGEIIAFTDDDVIVDPGWLRAVADAFDRTGCAGLGGKIIPVWPDKPPRWYSDIPPYWTIGPVVAYNLGDQTCEARIIPFGANMAMRMEVIRDLGYFRTDLGAGSGTRSLGEETDFFRRLKNSGRKVFYEPRAMVLHPVPPERESKKYFRRYYFELGRTLSYSQGLPEKAICYFGVPRYLFRELIEAFAKYIVTVDRKRRFYWQVVVCQVAGQITEMHHLSARK